jgi:malic enzyme
VAVTSDGSGLRNQGCRRLSLVGLLLSGHVTVIQELGGPPARPLLVNHAEDPRQLCTRLCPPRTDTGAVFLADMDPTRALIIQHCLGRTSAPPVISDHDTTATAITAAVLTTLSRAGRGPATSRIVLAGADELVLLGPLLTAAGFADITVWKQIDAPRFPLHRVARDADIVVDLANEVAHPPAGNDPAPPVITYGDPVNPILALPGILRALVETSCPRVDVDMYLAAAGALVAATPPDRLLPSPEPALTDGVAWAVGQALDHPRESP